MKTRTVRDCQGNELGEAMKGDRTWNYVFVISKPVPYFPGAWAQPVIHFGTYMGTVKGLLIMRDDKTGKQYRVPPSRVALID